ncbi:hypothetical protein MAR_012703 [Mya arenaria]|uniref:Myb-like domain-containing protein n=1 Tax=Mya arenaria TaxID=6604 RepID=A0ABY7G0H2_MYAAR|nr:hypothetical protein MAR_012703 [Mya arenaria]
MAAKKRSTNWSEEEKSTALELISSKGQKLFGSFRGASLGGKEKKELWESITQQLNASGVCCPYRTLEEVKIMYKNSKAAVKGKIDLTRKTGGGGMICLSQSEEVEQLLKMSMEWLRKVDGVRSSKIWIQISFEIS